jgi:hypothetical protein
VESKDVLMARKAYLHNEQLAWFDFYVFNLSYIVSILFLFFSP